MEQKTQWNLTYWLIAMLLLLTLQNWWQTASSVEPVPYSAFEQG